MKNKKLRKVLFAALVLIAFPVALNVLGLFMTKRYTAEMRVLIDETPPTTPLATSQFPDIDDIVNANRARSPQTQLDVMTGSDVLLAAVAMGHDKMPDKIQTDPAHFGDIYDTLVKKLSIDNELNSDVITLKVTQNDPDVAAELANDIGLAYQEYLKKLAAQGGAQEETLLRTTIAQASKELREVDRKISDVKSKSHVLDVTTAEQALEANASTAEQKLADIQGQFNGASAQLLVAEGELKKIPQNISTGSATQANPVLLAEEQSLAAERVALADAQSKYDDSFPMVKQEKQRVANIEKQVKGMTLKIDSSTSQGPNPVYQQQLASVVALRGQVKSLAGQLAATQAENDKATAESNAVPGAEQQLQGLIRDRTVAEQNYEALFQKLSAIEAAGMARQPQVEIVSPAYPPSTPSFPDPRLLTLAGIAIGGFCAVLILMPRPEAPYVAAPKDVEAAANPSLSQGEETPELAASEGSHLVSHED